MSGAETVRLRTVSPVTSRTGESVVVDLREDLRRHLRALLGRCLERGEVRRIETALFGGTVNDETIFPAVEFRLVGDELPKYPADSVFELEVRVESRELPWSILSRYSDDPVEFASECLGWALELLSLLGGVGAQSDLCAGSLLWEGREPRRPGDVLSRTDAALRWVEARFGDVPDRSPRFAAFRDGYFLVAVGPTGDLYEVLGRVESVYNRLARARFRLVLQVKRTRDGLHFPVAVAFARHARERVELQRAAATFLDLGWETLPKLLDLAAESGRRSRPIRF
ncbi:hypothetical protein [Methanopyrus kandleri]